MAQTPATADPSRIDDRLRPRPDAPGLGTPLDVPATPDQKAPEGAELQKFQISGVIFEGNQTLPEGRLQELASDYVNRDITLADVYELAGRATAAYRDAGYILTRAIVPAQRIGDGQLRIQVVEGFIENVEIEGDAGGAMPFLQSHARRIAAAKPLTADVLERELLLASDMAGFTVRSVLTPSKTTPGAADLTLVVEREAFEGYAGIDNFGSRYLGREEIVGAVFANDLFGTAGRVGFTGVVTPDGDPELAYGALSIQQPLTSTGLTLFASYSYSETRPGLELETIDTEGEAKTARVELSYPFIRSRDLNVIGTLGFFSNDVRSENNAVNPVFDDKVRNVNAKVFANLLDSWGGFNTGENLHARHHRAGRLGKRRREPFPRQCRQRLSAPQFRSDALAAHRRRIRPASGGRRSNLFQRGSSGLRGTRFRQHLLWPRLRSVRNHRREGPCRQGGAAMVHASSGRLHAEHAALRLL
ncbi:ShlB/FhaC/HecB family hemolysin secretion/activation protein [Tepidicaulis marinus]|nr:POTRA domain-containing protein [Tepidicaulis marinus]